jgi:hypothetical protein
MLAQSSQKPVLREVASERLLRHSLVLVRFRNSEIAAFDDIFYGVSVFIDEEAAVARAG